MDISELLKGKEGKFFCDLPAICEEKELLSETLAEDKWKILPYRTAKREGRALSAIGEMKPAPVTLDLGISGWHAVWLGMESMGSRLDVKLTGDRAFRRVENTGSFWHWLRYVEEDFFRIVNLKDGKLTLSRADTDKNATLYWVRALPLSDTEVSAYLADRANPDNRRLNVTEDFCEALARYSQEEDDPWFFIVEQYRDADVESMSIEYYTEEVGEMPYVPDPISRAVREGLSIGFGEKIQKKLIAYGHELGWKMYSSQRMSYGVFESPLQSANAFFSRFGGQTQYACEDRDGTRMNFLSYAYPEVRRKRIGELLRCASLGSDGVELICNRVPALALFEKPFSDRFEKKYGCDPRVLPLSDERVMREKAELLSEFFKELRNALDAECARLGRGRMSVCLKVPYSVYDCKLLGLDLELLAARGLVDRVVSYPVVMRENLNAEIWQDAARTRLDLEKYAAYAEESPARIIDRADYSGPGVTCFIPPQPDEHGVPQGPATLQERVEEFLALEKYGVEVGIDVLPRTMPPQEVLQTFRELTDLGVKHFSLWDTYARVVRLTEWCMTSRMGHAKELPSFSDGAEVLYRNERLLSLDGVDISRYLPNWIG